MGYKCNLLNVHYFATIIHVPISVLLFQCQNCLDSGSMRLKVKISYMSHDRGFKVVSPDDKIFIPIHRYASARITADFLKFDLYLHKI